MISKKRRMTWIAAAAVVASSNATAQTQGAKQPTAQQMRAQRMQQIQRMREMRRAGKEKMYKELAVTPAQRKKLDAIEAAAQRQVMNKFTAMRATKTRPTAQQQQQAMGQIRAIAMQSRGQMMAVLTPAQRQKYAKITAEQVKKARAMRGASQAR